MLPLEGIRVVELTTAWAGPMAGRVLAFLGAEVFHIEAATRVNSWRVNKDRTNGVNYPDKEPGERPWDRSFLFNSQNVNKRSAILDIKKPEGLSTLRKLIAISDVMTCNFRPDMLRRMALDYESLRATNPGLIVAEMPAFGIEGPHAGYAALGPTMEMAAGMSASIAYPGGNPSVTGPSYLDPIGGFNAAAAVLTALFHRERTGEGQHIEMPQVESAMQLIGPELLAALDGQPDPVPDGNHVPHMAPHNAYPARGEDEWIVIAAEDDGQWRRLCAAMGHPELAEDGRFATLSARKANEAALDALVAGWTRDEDKHALAERLQGEGIAAAPVATPRDVAHSPYLAHRGFFSPLTHPEAGTHLHPGLPFHLSRTPGSARRAAPTFGQDNAYLLRDVLGLDAAEIAAIEASGAMTTIPNEGA
jgi:crotonobetainyl-CoA:carnitine CoA-transferase CaiB-like acyl-CoA transferase